MSFPPFLQSNRKSFEAGKCIIYITVHLFFSLTRILLFVECFFLHVHGRQAIYCRDMLGHYIARMLDLFYLFRFRDTTTRNIQKPICYVHVDVFHHVAIAAFHCLAEFQQEPACCLFSMRCKTPCFGYVFDCFCMYCVCVCCVKCSECGP